MESLQDWGLLGEFYIGYGFIRGRFAGIYYDILGAGLWSPKGVAESPEGDSLYGSPPRRSFCAYASSRAALHVGSPSLRLGAAPQDPLTLKLRLDTNDAKASSVRRRRYILKAPAAHFIRFLQTNSRKLRCQDYGLNKQLFG